jgi:hypothetical protein
VRGARCSANKTISGLLASAGLPKYPVSRILDKRV